MVFATCAAGLALGGRRDRRARDLALYFLLIASEFADRLLLRLSGPIPSAADALLTLGHVQVEAFLPYVLWRFVRDFPRVAVAVRQARIPRVALPVSFGVGVVLLAVNLIHVVGLLTGSPSPLFKVTGAFSRYEEHTLYQATLFVLMLPTLPVLIRRGRRAAADERRRVRLLLVGLVAGSAPMLTAVVVMSFWPAADAVLSRPAVFRWLEVLVYTGTLSLPVVTAYSVLVQHALDVRLVVRKAVQYALARYTVIATAVAPLLILAVLLFTHRHQSLAGLVSGPAGVLLVAVAVLGFAMLWLRRRILAWIDRRFFREQYDAAQTLHALVEGSRNVADVARLEELLLREVDRAFHLESGALLVRAAGADLLASPSARCRPLAADSHLARLLASAGAPVPIDLAEPDPLTRSLPRDDRQWLADAGIRLLVPLVHDSGELSGILALGAKRSELPYGREDRLLLATVASSAGIALEDRIGALPELGAAAASDTVAAECERCGAVRAGDQRRCPECGARMIPCKAPLLLGGKFRLESRIGRGGMGVVYLATDVHLGRRVAVKTLPWVAPYLSVRLRREARAMAAVAHPNLALIYGIEFFHGIPILVVEYLPRGTLADRLRENELPWPEALALGAALADAVDGIHGAGILHRDIKPSNVGFAADGTPKLLDFGLARAVDAARGLDLDAPASLDSEPSGSDELTGGGAVAGTVAYLSPEAISGEPPDPSFDIWGLSLVLYEAIGGTNPFQGAAREATVSNILYREVPDLRRFAPTCPPAVAEFFREALNGDRDRRPPTGRALARQLRSLLERSEGAPSPAAR